jgi:hypothetical protein
LVPVPVLGIGGSSSTYCVRSPWISDFGWLMLYEYRPVVGNRKPYPNTTRTINRRQTRQRPTGNWGLHFVPPLRTVVCTARPTKSVVGIERPVCFLRAELSAAEGAPLSTLHFAIVCPPLLIVRLPVECSCVANGVIYSSLLQPRLFEESSSSQGWDSRLPTGT